MITPSKSKRYSVRSNEERVLKVPHFKHDTFGKRAFAVYGPLAWNCLPKEIRLCDEIEAFKRNLKTHLFVKFVNKSTLAIWFWRIIVKRPRMLSAQFVALYKPCKPKPKPRDQLIKHQILLNWENVQCITTEWYRFIVLRWRHNERSGVSNHQPLDCLLKYLFRRRLKETSKLRVTGLCEGNSPLTGEFPAQRASNAENASIWWRHHGL